MKELLHRNMLCFDILLISVVMIVTVINIIMVIFMIMFLELYGLDQIFNTISLD